MCFSLTQDVRCFRSLMQGNPTDNNPSSTVLPYRLLGKYEEDFPLRKTGEHLAIHSDNVCVVTIWLLTLFAGHN